MKKFIGAVSALALALSTPLAFAATPQGNITVPTPPQVQSVNPGDLFQDIPNGIPSAQNLYISLTNLRAAVLGLNIGHAGTPTLTTSTSVCGGSTATILGTDFGGAITQGSTASTSCVLTFAQAYATAPACVGSINNVADTAFKLATTTTAITFTQTSASSNVTNYICTALPGG